MKRVLIIQENGRHEKNRNFRECFCMSRSLVKMGHEVLIWGLGHDNYDKRPDFNSYDIILNLENYDTTCWVPNLSEFKKPKKYLWSIDTHCTGTKALLYAFNTGKYDLILQATRDFVDSSSVWFPNCYDNHLIEPTGQKSHFIGFCGSLLNRAQLLDYLEANYDLKKDIFVLGPDMVEAVSSYCVHFNLNLSNDINYRSFETLGCGTLLLTNYNPQYEALGFVDGYNCLMYRDEKDLFDKIEFCKNNKKEVDRMTNNGIILAEKHTYDVRAQTLIEIYEPVS
tara:strand:- start:1124 stop:1969 length:846 start_codon:yes stop_codon:yes gene_type:complete